MQLRKRKSLKLPFAGIVVGALFAAAQIPVAGQLNSNGYVQHNLVSDQPGTAITLDSNLKNPWGMAFSPTGPFWIADNGTGLSTVYNGQAQILPLVVTIPPPMGSTQTATPTGIVFNGTPNFVVSSGGQSGPALFIFATEDGTISGWNPNVNPSAAILAVDNSSAGSVYKGLALASGGSLLFATDFTNNAVRVFNGSFNLVNSFTDPSLPAGFAPFGIANIQGLLYVTFALQNAENPEEDQPGFGNGFVDVFNTDGTLVRRFASQGVLNSPWGLALSGEFGPFSNSLLVGNFGDGTINAFDPATGDFLGRLMSDRNQPIVIEGLWALAFGNGGQAGNPRLLYFTAGINDEENGLFGDLQPAQSNSGIINP